MDKVWIWDFQGQVNNTFRVVHCKHAVVGLHDAARKLFGGVDHWLEDYLLVKLFVQLLQDSMTNTCSCAATKGMEDKEALQICTIVYCDANAIHHVFLDMEQLGHGTALKEIVLAILVVAHHIVRMKELAIF